MVFAAAMLPAGAFRVMFSMVIALHIGVKLKAARQQIFHCCVSFTGNTAVKLNSSFGKCLLSAAADTAADQDGYTGRFQKACQCTVTAAVGVYQCGCGDFAVFHVVEFKLFCVTKVLKNLSVFVSDCNFHRKSSCMGLCVLVFSVFGCAAMVPAAAAAAALCTAVTKYIVAALNE